ncbi:MAG: AAA family ATPase [Candidatus Poribacteria bacterium]|nr:AAA family ATPase [Candidatus Poribacteria bacterium]
MKITKIEISNFKSFENLSIHLNDFNLLVGANASGKSNFVQAFQFLRDIVNHGLENAISLQGGVEYLRNIKSEQSHLSFRIIMQGDSRGFWPGRQQESRLLKIHEIDYEFSLKFSTRSIRYAIDQDKITVICSIEYKEELEIPGVKSKPRPDSKKFSIKFSNLDGILKITPNNLGMDMEPSFLDGTTIFRDAPSYNEKPLLIESPVVGVFLRSALEGFKNTGIYDFDPKLSKKPVPITGLSELATDGSNLTIVLNNIIRTKENRRRFLNLFQDLLPFIHDINVERAVDKSIFFRLREKYAENKRIPASLISDGTVNIIALIIALYFEQKQVVIIEEPERNVHPYLTSRVMDMFREVSKNRQILTTTHNPEMVKHADLENILLITRDDEGFSRITKPADSDQIKIFLENEMGLDDLFVQNLLGV